MYRYYEKDGYEIMYYRFDSVTEYIDYLTTTTINKRKFPNPKSISGNYSFCKTKSFEEALELMKYGYHEDFEKLMELKITLEKYIKLTNKRSNQFNYYVGYVPDVKAYLEGNPLSMINKEKKARKKIDIYINTSYSGRTSSSAIFNRGAIVLTLIEILESLGFNVDLHLFEMSAIGNQVHYSDFILKKETERINPQKLYFPLCHPSWIRRLNFRLIETTPNINYSWDDSYGCPSNLSTMKKWIDLKNNDIIIPTIPEIGIKGNNIVNDTNRLFNYINSLSEKDFELKEIDKQETQNIDITYSNDCVISLKPTKYIKKRKII